jgi:hypothetical protein
LLRFWFHWSKWSKPEGDFSGVEAVWLQREMMFHAFDSIRQGCRTAGPLRDKQFRVSLVCLLVHKKYIKK